MITIKKISNSYMHKARKLFLFFVLISFSGALSAQSGKTGNLTWDLSADGTLTISGLGDMPNYKQDFDVVESPWYEYRLKIKTVIVNSGATNIGKCAFVGCTNLTSITIPNSVRRIRDAFGGCHKLTSVIIPDSQPFIESGTFAGCSSLTSVTIPNSVTWIGNQAFYHCSNLTSITIPSSVTKIYPAAFFSCEKLYNITVFWETPIELYHTVFSYIPKSATLHVPQGTKSLYQQAENWKEFKNIVEHNIPIDDKKKEEKIIPNPPKDLPEIEWQLSSNTNEKELNIKACIKSKTKIEQTSILVNGQGQSDRGIVNAEDNNNCAVSVNKNVILAEGKNTIKIQAKNANGVKEVEKIIVYEPIKDKGKRYALVIGNAAYDNGNELQNPVNDATDITAKLRDLDFIVTPLKNATSSEMMYAINDLENKAKQYDVIMFFYAGHATEHNKTNYLIPIKAKSEKEYIKVDTLLQKMQNANMKIIVLDACRTKNMRSGTGGSGLTEINTSKSKGTFIAFSTSPGYGAYDYLSISDRNSPYTRVLLKYLDKEGFLLDKIFNSVGLEVMEETKDQQQPWKSSSPMEDFYFNTKK